MEGAERHLALSVEDKLPPGQAVFLRGCPWYVVPRRQSDGSHILWDGEHEAFVPRRGSVKDGVLRLERLRGSKPYG